MSNSVDPAVLRILDANANRAREAFRVVEDYARFSLNSDEFCGEIKALRHRLADCLKSILTDAILFRDTPGDVGTGIKQPDEKSRADIADVVTAAGKRAGEALRTIEEYLKTAWPGQAGEIEKIRYRFYEVERRLALTFHRDHQMAGVRLYVLITESACKHPWLKTAELAIDGGADCLQLREKNLDDGEFLSRAGQLAELCRRRGVICIINDRPDIALLSGADGVHLGQEDLPASDARKILGSKRIIGVSTHNIEQAKTAVLVGADYIGVGPIFKSETKSRDFVAGLEYAAQAAGQIPIPSIAIAGIEPENVKKVLATGIRAVAVTAAVAGSDDVRAAAAKLKKMLIDDR